MKDVSVVALFCDDIRQETSGTVSIVGVYPDNMNVPSIPGGLLKLGIYLRIHIPLDFERVPILTWIELPDGKEINKDAIDPKLIENAITKASNNGAPYAGIVSSFVLGNFGISVPGRVKLMVQIGEHRSVAGGLNVRVPSTTAATT